MRNAVFGVCNGTIFIRFKIFTMRNLIFKFAMVQKRGISHKKWFKGLNELRKHRGDGFFYHEKSIFTNFHGKTMPRASRGKFEVALRHANTVQASCFARSQLRDAVAQSWTRSHDSQPHGNKFPRYVPMLTLPARKKGRPHYATPLGLS